MVRILGVNIMDIKVKLAPVLEKSGAMNEANTLRQEILAAKDILTRSTIYYVSNNGDDNNDGLSPEAPFKTFERVNAIPGGQYLVLFERGSVYRLTDGHFLRGNVNYGAYGEGPKPQILGSLRDYADPTLWTKGENDLWILDLNTEPAGLINFNNDTYIGVRKYEFEQIAEDGDYHHDTENGKLYLKLSNGNPGEVFENIEIGTVGTLWKAWNVNNVKIDNLCFKYGTKGGINAADCGDINITNCEFSWIGGSYFGGGHHRYGNAVEFWYRAYESSVKHCWFNQIFDAALTYQGSGPSETIFRDIHFEENLIEHCSMNFEFWTTRINSDGSKCPGGKMHGMRFIDNILRGAGYGWGGVQRPSKPDQAFLLSWSRKFNNDDMKNFYITDNIFDCADCNMVYCIPPSEQKGFYVRHNTYYQKKPTGINSHNQIIRCLDLNASNQEEFEYAIKQFEEKPDHIEWLED